MYQFHGLPFVDPSLMGISASAIAAVPAAFARKENVMPIALAGRDLTVAIENPLDFDLIGKLRFYCNVRIHPVLATPNAIRCAVARHYRDASDA
jgi:type IV pilus assembly protein PilB